MTAWRYLDSVGVTEWEKPMRTIRAYDVLVTPDFIYQRSAGSVWRWNRSTFFSRLASGEPLAMPEAQIRTPSEKILLWDGLINPDTLRGWKTGGPDSIDRLTGFDVDDQGYVYLAVTVYGWTIAEPVRMGALFQNQDYTPSRIIALKGASKYYAVMNGARGGAIYDVTTRATPVKLNVTVPNVLNWAKTSDASRVAIIDSRFTALVIYTADGLASGGRPLFSQGGYSAVTSDGTNFFALKAGVIEVLAPTGNTYNVVGSFPLDPTLPAISKIHFGEGHIVTAGDNGMGVYGFRLYRVSNLALIPVPITIDLSAQGTDATDGSVVKAPDGSLKLFICAKAVGDVYTLEGSIVVPPPPPPPPPQPVTTAGKVIAVEAREFDTTAEAQKWADSVQSIHTTLPLFITSKGTTVVVWF